MPASPNQNVLFVYGTRPEAIKLAPILDAMRGAPGLTPVVCATGQHREMLDQVHEIFGIVPDHDLDVIEPRQTLAHITATVLDRIVAVLESVLPRAVVVQGDTTSTFTAALAAFYEQIPVVHVEAGLRTHKRYAPFPEEANRTLTARLATLHLAPTPASAANLVAEGIARDDIVVTGNTVIDALHAVLRQPPPLREPALAALSENRHRTLLVTAHRRESWGEPMRGIARALRRLVDEFDDLQVVFPVHRNPAVRDAVLPLLDGHDRVVLTEPLDYADFSQVLQRAHVVLTDSGGVQEEAPSLGKPVLVLRSVTERPEAVAAGVVRLVGADEAVIVEEVGRLFADDTAWSAMATGASPYGDGRAAARSVAAIRALLLGEPRPEEFRPT